MPTVLLAYYCALILVASIIGGMIPVWFQLTHRWMQIAVSFVAGVMLGIGVLHMLPHAILDATAAAEAAPALSAVSTGTPTTLIAKSQALNWTMISLLAGMLTMFFIERFFSFHHHDVPQAAEAVHASHHHDEHTHDPPEPAYDLSWSGAALGLALHSMLNGIALGAAVQHRSQATWLAGFGTFLVIFLHKPFDAMTISMLMGAAAGVCRGGIRSMRCSL